MGMIEELKEYLENTPREQALADWKECEKFDSVGPTVSEFLHNTEMYKNIQIPKRDSVTYIVKSQPIPEPINISSIYCHGKLIYTK